MGSVGDCKREEPESAPLFWCDAGLGGLARWLRAAGYDAEWDANIEDGELLRTAKESHAIVLTTDAGIMERRVIAKGEITALLLPPVGTIQQQLAAVVQRFGLKQLEPRCMQCGGRLLAGDKQALRERIPPKTFAWLDEYFLCERCGKLFWRGSHWHRIGDALAAAFERTSD